MCDTVTTSCLVRMTKRANPKEFLCVARKYCFRGFADVSFTVKFCSEVRMTKLRPAIDMKNAAVDTEPTTIVT